MRGVADFPTPLTGLMTFMLVLLITRRASPRLLQPLDRLYVPTAGLEQTLVRPGCSWFTRPPVGQRRATLTRTSNLTASTATSDGSGRTAAVTARGFCGHSDTRQTVTTPTPRFRK